MGWLKETSRIIYGVTTHLSVNCNWASSCGENYKHTLDLSAVAKINISFPRARNVRVSDAATMNDMCEITITGFFLF